tara:strand:+ start:1189 stop:1494 length:306 start_codon:yes stop_codon:yes gene_type:complete
MEKLSVDYISFHQPNYKGKIVIPTRKTIIEESVNMNFEINQEKAKLKEEYKFIDLDKLLKRNNVKSYTIAELRDVAGKIGIPITNSKTELNRLIKLKIGVE